MEQNSGGLIGGVTTICAVFMQIIPVQTAVQTIQCAAIGAAVGFIVTYLFKKFTFWFESKLTSKKQQ